MFAEMAQQHGAIETAIAQMMEHVQRKNMFNEGVRASFTSLLEEVLKHQDNFPEVVRILQTHEEHIVKTGVASQEVAQRINMLIQENENKTAWISPLMRDSQEQTHVLRPHKHGLQLWAEVIKRVANQQPRNKPQQYGTTGTSPTVTESDDQDGDRLDFLGGQNPNTGPPNPGAVRCDPNSTSLDRNGDGAETVLSVEGAEERDRVDKQSEENAFLKTLLDETKELAEKKTTNEVDDEW